ncbi:acyltransferase [Peribacillus sp. NPDC096379]|uniref:acyltransferase n=1 Tax=Peribacillus sp. NPDC096379 TaxID=3364393 RepID=UPI00382FF0FD
METIKKIIKKFQFIRARNPYQIALFHKKNGVKMGSNCQIFGGVSFGSEPYLISLGNNVKITAKNQFITHDGGINVLRNLDLLPNADKFGKIVIGDNVFIGIGCTIMPGVKIGDNVVIGTGSIVTKDIPSNSVAAGVPCKVIKSIDDYYRSLNDEVDYTKNMGPNEKKEYLIKKYCLNNK